MVKALFFSVLLSLTGTIYFWQSYTKIKQEQIEQELEYQQQKNRLAEQLQSLDKKLLDEQKNRLQQSNACADSEQKLSWELDRLQQERKELRAEIARLDQQIALNTTVKTAMKPLKNATPSITPPNISPPNIIPAKSDFLVFPLNSIPLSAKEERKSVFFIIPPQYLIANLEIEYDGETSDYFINPKPARSVQYQKNRLVWPTPINGGYRLSFTAPKNKRQRLVWRFNYLQNERQSHYEILL